MAAKSSMAGIPSEIRCLIQETLDLVRAHPKHEMGQHQRRRIYAALWSTPQGDEASRWLAILAARRIQPIYEQSVMASSYANRRLYLNARLEEGSVIGLVDRMLEMAEAAAKGMLTKDDFTKGTRSGEIEDFYHNILVAAEDEFPCYVWLAALAADGALGEALGYRPLETIIGGEDRDENGNVVYSRSDTWSDDRLVGSGCHADDASVDAAYAFARMTIEGKYDTSKLLEFWEWWLNKGIPEAWRKAGEEQQAC